MLVVNKPIFIFKFIPSMICIFSTQDVDLSITNFIRTKTEDLLDMLQMLPLIHWHFSETCSLLDITNSLNYIFFLTIS